MLNQYPSGTVTPVTPVPPIQYRNFQIVENLEDVCPHCGTVIHGHYCGACEVTVH